MTDLYSFDPAWEEKYLAGYSARYPFDFVGSFIFRNLPKNKPRSEVRILEVGWRRKLHKYSA